MPEEESVNLFRLNTIKEGDKMPCFIILLCLCLFPFSTARCEEQAVVESLNASMLTIWGGNKDESLSSTYHTSNGDIVLLAQTDSTLGTPALSSRTAGGTRDGWILRVSNMGELKSETLLSWEGTPFILGAVENPESLCMIVAESIDRTEYVEDTGYDDFTPEKADFETEDDFARFMDFVKSANLHENDMTVTGGDHLLTLITCDRTYGGADGRFVVMAVRED